MKHLLILSVLVGSLFAETRPNLIFILSDDHRNDELSCAGNKILKTPVLDELASRGKRFSNAFVTTPICAASRASILTGLYEREHGYTFGKPPISKAHVAASYPIQLRDAGYHTGFFGKFGVQLEGSKRNIGTTMFDKFERLHRGPFFKKQKDGTLRHVDELIGDRAVKFIKDCPTDKPFSLSLSFNIAHAEDGDKRPGIGHFAWPKAVDGLYENHVIPEPRLNDKSIFDAHPEFLKNSMNRLRFFWRWDTPEKYQLNMRARYRMITGMDRIIGRVVKQLEDLKLRGNTVIIFLGDNGYYRGQRGFAGKWSHYEESLRVPLIIVDPRLPKNQQGKVVKETALNIDVAPTLLKFAGLKAPAIYSGHALTPTTPQRDFFFCEHTMVHKDIPRWEGVRNDRYTYANFVTEDGPYEFLHDRKTDPDQLINLVNDPKFTKVLEKLRQQIEKR